MELPGFARALDLADDRLFVGTSTGITLYDISDPLNPVEEAEIDLEGVETAGYVDQAPAGRSVASAYPNPFRHSLFLRLEGASADDHHRITVVDMMGRTIRVLHEGRINRSLTVQWDGRDQTGADTAPGLYMIRNESSRHVQSQGVVKVR